MASHTSRRIQKKRKLVEFAGVFTFDLIIGQKCEYLYPENTLCSDDLKAIAMLSFPDSQSLSGPSNMDCTYVFRFYPLEQDGYKINRPSGFQCYVYFRQVEDLTSPRGYYQKSIVVMSSSSDSFANSHDMFNLVRLVGTKFYAAEKTGREREVLMEACDHIETFLGMSPKSIDMMLIRRTSSISTRSAELSSPRRATSSESDDVLFTLVEGLWHVWEGLLTDMPILVYAPNDSELCSKAVISIGTLIDPIEYRGQMLPVLSVFDRKYSELRHTTTRSARLVGVTSPMAASQLVGSFSILVVLTSNKIEDQWEKFVPVVVSKTGSGIYVSDTISSVSSGTRTRVSSAISSARSDYRLSVPADMNTVSKKIVAGFNGNGDALNRNTVRKYFSTLTRDFLLPFLPYIEADESAVRLDPIGNETSQVLKFESENFFSKKIQPIGYFSTLSDMKLTALYRQFVSCSVSFAAWLESSQSEANFHAIVHHCQMVKDCVDILWLSPLEKERVAARVVDLQHRIGDHSEHSSQKLAHCHKELNQILNRLLAN